MAQNFIFSKFYLYTQLNYDPSKVMETALLLSLFEASIMTVFQHQISLSISKPFDSLQQESILKACSIFWIGDYWQILKMHKVESLKPLLFFSLHSWILPEEHMKPKSSKAIKIFIIVELRTLQKLKDHLPILVDVFRTNLKYWSLEAFLGVFPCLP